MASPAHVEQQNIDRLHKGVFNARGLRAAESPVYEPLEASQKSEGSPSRKGSVGEHSPAAPAETAPAEDQLRERLLDQLLRPAVEDPHERDEAAAPDGRQGDEWVEHMTERDRAAARIQQVWKEDGTCGREAVLREVEEEPQTVFRQRTAEEEELHEAAIAAKAAFEAAELEFDAEMHINRELCGHRPITPDLPVQEATAIKKAPHFRHLSAEERAAERQREKEEAARAFEALSKEDQLAQEKAAIRIQCMSRRAASRKAVGEKRRELAKVRREAAESGRTAAEQERIEKAAKNELYEAENAAWRLQYQAEQEAEKMFAGVGGDPSAGPAYSAPVVTGAIPVAPAAPLPEAGRGPRASIMGGRGPRASVLGGRARRPSSVGLMQALRKGPTAEMKRGPARPSLMERDSKFPFLVKLLVDRAGSCLAAWLKHFDKDGDQKITFEEFCVGLRELHWEGNVISLFRELDEDGSGVITLEEIDQETCDIWRSFQRWCASHFKSARDMVAQLNPNGSHKVTEDQFLVATNYFGWRGGFETLLFHAIDIKTRGFLLVDDLRFVDRERKKVEAKETAKRKAALFQKSRARTKVMAARALADFKRHLRKRYSSYTKAWRQGIDLDGSMSVMQKELFKACKEMQWPGDVRMLWRALDSDDSGVTGLEELDILSAQVLARFKNWAEQWGSCVEGFRKLDRRGSRMIKPKEFVKACRQLGFNEAQQVFEGIVPPGQKFITERDVDFLDEWRPPAWLVAEASEKAADEFRACLLKKYDNFLKAWRRVLDRDNSNRVSWHEYMVACKKIDFQGDAAGAWRNLDDDLSGWISLKEIDREAHVMLKAFKLWMDEEFGGVRSGFYVLDTDGSGELSAREFRRAVRDFGFEGDSRLLFDALRPEEPMRTEKRHGKQVQPVQRVIGMEDIAFLDGWDHTPEEDPLQDENYDPVDEEETKQKVYRPTSPRVLELAVPRTDKSDQSQGASPRQKMADQGPLARRLATTAQDQWNIVFRHVIGGIAGLPKYLQRALDPAGFPVRLSHPSAQNEQPYATYAAQDLPKVSKLLVRPMGTGPLDLRPLKPVLEAFFPFEVVWEPYRKVWTGSDVASGLQAARPEHALVLGIASHDLGDGGCAARRDHTALVSCRVGAEGPEQLARLAKLCVHEVLHLGGLKHCTVFKCVLNEFGPGGLATLGADLCPACLHKVYRWVRFKPVGRYLALSKAWAPLCPLTARLLAARALMIAPDLLVADELSEDPAPGVALKNPPQPKRPLSARRPPQRRPEYELEEIPESRWNDPDVVDIPEPLSQARAVQCTVLGMIRRLASHREHKIEPKTKVTVEEEHQIVSKWTRIAKLKAQQQNVFDLVQRNKRSLKVPGRSCTGFCWREFDALFAADQAKRDTTLQLARTREALLKRTEKLRRQCAEKKKNRQRVGREEPIKLNEFCELIQVMLGDLQQASPADLAQPGEPGAVLWANAHASSGRAKPDDKLTVDELCDWLLQYHQQEARRGGKKKPPPKPKEPKQSRERKRQVQLEPKASKESTSPSPPRAGVGPSPRSRKSIVDTPDAPVKTPPRQSQLHVSGLSGLAANAFRKSAAVIEDREIAVAEMLEEAGCT